jgi:hypothetical protein
MGSWSSDLTSPRKQQASVAAAAAAAAAFAASARSRPAAGDVTMPPLLETGVVRLEGAPMQCLCSFRAATPGL